MKKERMDGAKESASPMNRYIIDVGDAPVMIFEWDVLTNTMAYSKNWVTHFGHAPDQKHARNYISNIENIHPGDFPAYKKLWEEVSNGAPYSSAQLRVMNTGKEYTWYRFHVVNQFDQTHKPVKAVGLVFNINEEMQALARLRNKAERDPLTGLLNREETEAQIKSHLQKKPANHCVLFMIDTDNFKQINDSKGHMLGDVVLTELAAGMKKLMPKSDIVGRIGGDEFTIFMKDVPSRTAAEQKAEELTQMFRHLFEEEKQVVHITCSIGAALYPEDGTTFSDLYKCADQALYQAKSRGKNQYVIYDKKYISSLAEDGYSSLGATIDSENRSASASSDLITLVFKILYEMPDADQALNLALEIVGKRFDVSRAYIFEQSDDGQHCSNTFEWCNEGITPEIENLQNVDSALTLYWGSLFSDNSIFYCRDTSTLPKEAKELLEGQDIHSTLQCALWEDPIEPEDKKKFSGFVGFDECTGWRLWTKEEVVSLSLIAEILTTFLLKKRLQACNKELIAREKEVSRIEAEQQKAAEASIMECIQWLSSSDYLTDAIDYVLTIVQKYYQSDRVYIIETDEEIGIACNTYEICAPGVEAQMHLLQEVPLEAMSFWMEQFRLHEYIKVEDVDALGEDRRMEREILQLQGVGSLMAVPLNAKGKFKGFLGVDDPKKHKDEIHYLSELSYFLVNEIIKKALQRKLEKMSYIDAMTGLENRNSYMAYCDDFYTRQPAGVGVIFLDINGLKKINDTQGHVCGDLLVTYVANMMKKYFPGEKSFRLSGDEFLIITEKEPYEQFKANLNALKSALLEKGQYAAAIGMTWSDIDADLNELQNKAERLMYISKQGYYKNAQGLASKKMPLLESLAKDIQNKEYLIYLQPKLNLKTGLVESAEALVRYREKDGSISAPVKFIPLLEREGFISQIDFFVLQEVCGLLTKWQGTGFSNIKLSLNFSKITLFDEHFWEQFEEIFKRYEIAPDQLEIEVTETQETLNKKEIASLFEQMKGRGFHIALDDFGVEYSSYEFLMMANFDLLKLDRGIIQKYEKAEKGETLVRHMIEMSHAIGSQCCAEGVETVEQLDFLKKAGCDYAQGYLIDKPTPVEAFEAKYQ